MSKFLIKNIKPDNNNSKLIDTIVVINNVKHNYHTYPGRIMNVNKNYAVLKVFYDNIIVKINIKHLNTNIRFTNTLLEQIQLTSEIKTKLNIDILDCKICKFTFLNKNNEIIVCPNCFFTEKIHKFVTHYDN